MSFANLQAQMIKDYKRAFKAGDYSGEELTVWYYDTTASDW